MHIALVGYRACGKTTLGRMLGDRLHRMCVDVDHELEQGEGCDIATIFKRDGEGRFRDLEHQYLDRICHSPTPLVISTGGGCIVREDNRRILEDSCSVCVYLDVAVDTLVQRLKRNGGSRPSLSGRSVDQEVADILEQRRPLYELAATHTVDANGDLASIEQSILRVIVNVEN